MLAQLPPAVQQMLQQQEQQIAHLQQQQAQMLAGQQQQQQQQPPQAPQMDLQQLGLMLAHQQQQQASANALAQQQLAVQLVQMQSLGTLARFSGKGAVAGTQTDEWLRKAERWFAAREASLNIAAGPALEQLRVTQAVDALVDEAARWYETVPAAGRPTTWADFRKLLLQRYSSVSTESVRLQQLRAFAAAGSKLRDKLTLEGMQTFLARFQQLAGELPSWLLSDHGKLELLGQALPAKVAEPVWTEHRKDPTLSALTPLHELATKVLNKAYFREYAAHGGLSGPSAAAGSSAPAHMMDINAVQFCAAQFDVDSATAQRYLLPAEGWAAHDTGSEHTQHSAAAAGSSSLNAFEERILNAFESRYGKPQSQRRMVPKGVSAEVPADLATKRREAGLCIKCGIVKYEAGGRGHNSRTCKAAPDKTTSTHEGRRKAGLGDF